MFYCRVNIIESSERLLVRICRTVRVLADERNKYVYTYNMTSFPETLRARKIYVFITDNTIHILM